MQQFMNLLYGRFAPLVEAKWFKIVMTLIIFLNPLAILPQLIAVLTSPSVDGVAVNMWYMFTAIQTAFVFHGIQTKSPSVFFSMLISLSESIIIIVTVYVRT
jgi:uncharacterized protein with PQ loop repeat